MALKSTLAEFQRHILKRSHKGDGSNSPRSVVFRDLKFMLALDSSIPEIQPPKKQKGKKATKEKKII